MLNRLPFALAAAVSLIGLAQIASAADLPRKAPAAPPPPPPVFSWTGFYVGGLGTYGWTNSEHCDAGTCAIPGVVYPDFRMKGWLGGVTVGYNWQWSQNWVLGVEGDWSWGKIDGSAPDTDGRTSFVGTRTISSTDSSARELGANVCFWPKADIS